MDRPDIAVYVRGPLVGQPGVAYVEFFEPGTLALIARYDAIVPATTARSFKEAWEVLYSHALAEVTTMQLELPFDSF